MRLVAKLGMVVALVGCASGEPVGTEEAAVGGPADPGEQYLPQIKQTIVDEYVERSAELGAPLDWWSKLYVRNDVTVRIVKADELGFIVPHELNVHLYQAEFEHGTIIGRVTYGNAAVPVPAFAATAIWDEVSSTTAEPSRLYTFWENTLRGGDPFLGIPVGDTARTATSDPIINFFQYRCGYSVHRIEGKNDYRIDAAPSNLPENGCHGSYDWEPKGH